MSTRRKSSPILQLEQVGKSYVLDGVTVPALSDITLKIDAGELVAIVGPSGSGKSTLMHIMGLLDRQSTGRVHLAGQDVSHLTEPEAAKLRNTYLGFIFQQFNLLPRTSALENVLLPTIYRGQNDPGIRAKAISLLTGLGMGDRLKNNPNQLSGGQQQRVAIARALINDPKIIFADEPTGNLDTKSGSEVIEILRELHRAGRTIVIVTHDPSLAKIAPRIIHVLDGKLVRPRGAKQ